MNWLRALLAILALGLIQAQPAGVAQQGDEIEIEAIRFAGAGEVTRIIIESNREIAPRTSVQFDGGQPSLIVDLPLLVWRVGGRTTSGGMGVGYGQVAGFRYGQSGPELSRLVLDLEQPAQVFRELSLPPEADAPRWRYTIDLMPDTVENFARQAQQDARRLARSEPRSQPTPRTTQPVIAAATVRTEKATTPLPTFQEITRPASQKRYVIVIDPGHGGKDPGAMSIYSSLPEKDVNLKTALAIKAILEKHPRFEVKLTRETDVFIELEDRVKLAREWGADLFISVHADSAGSPTAKGASVYTLSESGAKRSKRVAKAQDWQVDFGTEQEVAGEVADILTVFVERETNTQSSLFAESLIDELADAGPMLRNTHRKAGFVVLFAPDVPAVLLELGFLTNAEDARRLASERGRADAAQAIAEAIEGYFAAREMRLADR